MCSRDTPNLWLQKLYYIIIITKTFIDVLVSVSYHSNIFFLKLTIKVNFIRKVVLSIKLVGNTTTKLFNRWWIDLLRPDNHMSHIFLWNSTELSIRSWLLAIRHVFKAIFDYINYDLKNIYFCTHSINTIILCINSMPFLLINISV